MKHRFVFFTLTALLALAAAWATLDLTEPPGPGLDPDATAYLGAGISLATGHGLRVPTAIWFNPDTTAPLSHFPPGFPTLIAAGIRVGLIPTNAARFIEAASAATTVAFVAFLLFEAGTTIGAFTAVALLAVTPAMVIMHASVLSEPLFLALFVCFVWQLSRHGENNWRRTLALGALAAAATLVRYAGASLIIAAVLDAWLGDERTILGNLSERIRRAALAGALPVLTLAAWAFTRPHTPDGHIRRVAFYADGLGSTFLDGAETFGRWLAPDIDSLAVRSLTAILMGGALMLLFVHAARVRRSAPSDAPCWYHTRVQQAIAITSSCYALVLIASRVFADPMIPFDERLLAPLLVLGTLTIAFTLGTLWQSSEWRSAHRVMLLGSVVTVTIWMFGASRVSAGWINDYRTDGGDLAGREWRQSPLADWAAHAGASVRLYSNWPEAIWFNAGRASYDLPINLLPATVTEFREKITREHGALVAFTWPATDLVPPDSLAKLAGLVPVARWPQGTVWRVAVDVATIHR